MSKNKSEDSTKNSSKSKDADKKEKETVPERPTPPLVKAFLGSIIDPFSLKSNKK